MTPFRVVIPSRFESTRLPGKPLLDIVGKPMIQHVHERAQESGAAEVVIATDDARIQKTAEAFGATVCMTSTDHPSGTDRIAEVARQCGWADSDIVVNLQGDEPLLPGELVQRVAADLAHYEDASVSTLCIPIVDVIELFDPNAVKVVLDAKGFALYFSRAPIPWQRDDFAGDAPSLASGARCYRHLGLYAYRVGFLHRYVTWSASAMELAESLEQLRVLHNGERIHASTIDQAPPAGVDTPLDLDRVIAVLSAQETGVSSD
ncbi:MAG TPA: 3-deoxy-manno-octulosonate cytidylyltransferase [Chromatiaceae bacterium]|jgi:3-deoxy-manno-octulosonate cytidylyltransferase (CMP-KDO synthetase)|nr:3-deoxy-manno-octulosonate cytidylyltransferase [Chromatiaceae bacterium]HIN81878.1 3-deoxy-manno-octulosonate cytidylyltransferase [Chromatiales bacterium]